MLSTVLLVLVVIILIGGAVPWGPWTGPVAPGQPARTSVFHGYGHGTPVGLILIVLVIVAVLNLLGVF